MRCSVDSCGAAPVQAELKKRHLLPLLDPSCVSVFDATGAVQVHVLATDQARCHDSQEDLKALKKQFDSGQMSQEAYDTRRRQIIDSMTATTVCVAVGARSWATRAAALALTTFVAGQAQGTRAGGGGGASGQGDQGRSLCRCGTRRARGRGSEVRSEAGERDGEGPAPGRLSVHRAVQDLMRAQQWLTHAC